LSIYIIILSEFIRNFWLLGKEEKGPRWEKRFRIRTTWGWFRTSWRFTYFHFARKTADGRCALNLQRLLHGSVPNSVARQPRVDFFLSVPRFASSSFLLGVITSDVYCRAYD